MKFIEQQDLPQPAKRLCRVSLLPSKRRQRGSRFPFHQAVLQLTVKKLDSSLGCESGSVVFQVFLADPDWQGLARNLFVELSNATHLDVGQSWKSAKPARTFEHFPGGTTAAGLRELERGGVRAAVAAAIDAAKTRSEQLGITSE